ncbi:MAG: imidazole glycerol phosphate synthase subunit HisH [Ruminococcus sp.]|nr:imidazole glycerol phosphate synthase subunit HisH [Ruminococcus sp.]
MIAIIDYGAGNIFSVKNALDDLGIESVLTSDKEVIRSADKIILPGVGAFKAAMEMLNASGLVDTLKEQARLKPFLGICLGMQLMFEKSFEFGESEGLGLIKGYVDRIDEPELVIPHMGWNKLVYNHNCPLFEGIDESYVYFVHSYKAFCDDKDLYAYCEYGHKVPAVVGDGKYLYGCQFHPEKSGAVGLKMLQNFSKM